MERLTQLPITKAEASPEIANTVLDDIKRPIASHGFGGFWFQGIANSAYEDYRENNRGNLLTRRTLQSAAGVLASSPTVQQLHQQYLARVAATDINFGEALCLKSPYCYVFDEGGRPNKAKKLFNRYGVNTIVSWPLKNFASNAWSGRFTLLAKHEYKDLNLTGLEVTLKQAQMNLFEHFHDQINPYRQYKLFNKTAIKALRMAATGLHNHEISQELHITVRGVEYHLESMRNKLSASNRANLVHIAHQLEII